jgi:Cys-rich protein (TIGR01571 family)
VLVDQPEWKGGLFDVGMEPTVSVLSSFCCVCVFGWNMERLGFGNRYVHIITFVLICTAPFWIFDLAALNLTNRLVRSAIGGTGIALCIFGLLYGGYWRIQMREKFKLPSNSICCGKPAFTDCFQWLFCPLCSLCQEVRTAEFYDIKDDKFYIRNAVLPTSPPPGLASPHTPAATLGAVKETQEPMAEMNLVDVELRGHDSPYRGSPPLSKSPLSPPAPVTATRNINGLHTGNAVRATSPLRSSPASPSQNPFVNEGASPNRNPFFQAFPPSDSTTIPSTSNNPFVQPELYSRGASPLRSPQHSSSNPFTQVELTSQASEALMRSPMRSPHRLSATNPFTPPEILSPAGELNSSPLNRASPSQNPFYPPEMSHPAANPSPPYTVSSQSGSSNPFGSQGPSIVP